MSHYEYPGYREITAQIGRRAHPDVLANRVAQEVLSRVISCDPNARADINVIVGNSIFLDNKIRSINRPQKDELAELIRGTIERAGYSEEWGYDPRKEKIIIVENGQSANIDRAVSSGGAGDTITKFGFATSENSHGLTLSSVLAAVIAKQLDLKFINNDILYLGPDGKVNVGVVYWNGAPEYASFVVVAAQHLKGLNEQQLENFKRSIAYDVVIPDLSRWYDPDRTRIIVNGAGLFDDGGPSVDAGVKGKKDHDHSYGDIIGTRGGSAYGKDGSKLDLQGHLLTRNIALSIVRSNLAKAVKVFVTYPIGYNQPIAVGIDTMGTGCIPDTELERIVMGNFSFEPADIIARFDLKKPEIFPKMAEHFFGWHRFNWECPVDLSRH